MVQNGNQNLNNVMDNASIATYLIAALIVLTITIYIIHHVIKEAVQAGTKEMREFLRQQLEVMRGGQPNNDNRKSNGTMSLEKLNDSLEKGLITKKEYDMW